MFGAIRKEVHTLSSAVNPAWNWRSLRPIVNPILPTENVLPEVARDFMRCAGEVAGGTFIIYGGALNDLANGRTPKDFDGHCLTRNHPLIAMYRVESWAKQQGYEVSHYRRRVRLLWKRLKIGTDHGEYDISFLQGKMALNDLVRQMADEADVSPCARSATADSAFQSQRCIDGENQERLIFRPFRMDRDRFRHLDRWHKYAIVKYPDRPVVYQCADDAVLFSELDIRRSEVRALHAELSKQGEVPKNFEPFRPLMPDWYDQLLAKAKAQLTN